VSVTTRVIASPASRTSKSGKPVVVRWKGCPMIRGHSIRAAVDQIVRTSTRLGFTKVNIIGASGSGKTSLAQMIAHLCHSMAKIPYSVRYFTQEELTHFTETIKTLSTNNQILLFDDLSWMNATIGKKKIEEIKSQITTIRHIDSSNGDSNEDRKIIMIQMFHAQKSLDKFLRTANFTFYSSCSQEEIDYLQDLLGIRYAKKIEQFKKLRIQSNSFGKFSFALGRKEGFTYKSMEPFLPYLFTDGDSTRFVVAPLRSWVQPICQTCAHADKSEATKLNLDNFVNDYTTKFSQNNAKQAVRIKLFQQGLNTYPKRIMQAMAYIERYLSKKQINLDELALAFGLNPKETKLFPDKQPVFVKQQK